MEIGGIMLDAFKTVFGNPDIMAIIISFSILLTFFIAILEMYRKSKR